MNEKSGWFGNILGKHSVKPLATSAKRCPAGHPMAMDWQKCPYCEAAKNAAERTRVGTLGAGGTAGSWSPATEAATPRPGPSRSPDPGVTQGPPMTGHIGPASSPSARRSTMVDQGSAVPYSQEPRTAAPAAASSRRHTSVMDVQDMAAPGAQPRPGGGRSLTGIVFTFSWSKLGQLFEIRDGRNYIGSGVVGTEGGRPVDVLVTDDDKLSGAHFLILCQGEKYRIRDCDSTNGTFVNGEQIDSVGIDLRDGSLIQAGATVFAFQKTRPPSGMPAASRLEPEPDEVVPKPAPPPHSPRRQRPPDEDNDPSI